MVFSQDKQRLFYCGTIMLTRECFSQGQGQVIYLCVRYKEFMTATPDEQQWTMRALAVAVAVAQ